MTHLIGQTVLQYKIVEKLGEGGMGVVYKAEDTKLRRTVALKFLPHDIESHESERARFLQEAQAAALLNHPNICTIHDIQEHEGEQFIVMEYVDGNTLRQMVPIQKMQTAIDYAVQIGEALQEAHSKGIVHRDIKTDNIMVNSKNQIKVMDFGLAKLRGSLKLTKSRSTVGTLAYMAPEQIQGGQVDARSDIFSFGVVLYEMLTGQLPFKGEHEAGMMYSILNQEPEPLERHIQDAPSELHHILNRALEKEPEDRYQSVQDMLIDLRRLKKVTSKVVTGPQPARPPSPGGAGSGLQEHARTPPIFMKAKQRTVLLSTGAVVLLAVSLVLYFFHSKAPLKGLVLSRTQITFSGNVRLSDISPDGKSFAYADKNNAVYVQDISGGKPIEVFRGENPRDLRWAPNGTQLAVLDWPSGRISIVPRFGGPSRRLGSTWGSMLSWSPDEAGIVFAGEEGDLWIASTVTNEMPHRIHTQDRLKWNVGLDWSPSGRSIALQCFDSLNIRRKILIIPIDAKKQSEIVNDSSGNGIYTPRPVWSSRGDAVYYVRGAIPNQDLMNINVDPSDDIPRGSPRTVLTGLPFSGFSFSKDNKRLVGLWRQTRSNIWTAIRSGPVPGTITEGTQITEGTSIITDARISPDGNHIAYTRIGQSGADLYVVPFGGGVSTRLTFDGKVSADFDERRLAWSPDGREIAYISNRSGVPRVYVTATDGSNARLVGGNATSPDAQISWAPGRFILYQLPGNRNFQILDPQTGAERLLVGNDKVGWMFCPCSSPRGETVAIGWNRSGKSGVWLVSTEDTIQRFLIGDSAGMGANPLCWSRDGQSLLFCKLTPNSSGSYGSNIVYSVSIATGKEEIFLTLKNTDSHIKDLDPTAKNVVWTEVDSHADVWMIENFDPDVE